MSRWHADIALLALLVTFPVIGVLSVLCIGILILQKLRLQTRLDDSYWWLINYSDITIIRDSQVCLSACVLYLCVCVFACLVLCSQVCLCLLQVQGLSLSTASQSVSSGSQSTFSNNSCGFRDKAGKEHVYSTIGLYQVPALFTLHATLRKQPGKFECFGTFPQKSNDL